MRSKIVPACAEGKDNQRKSTIGRLWRHFELKPHRSETVKLSAGPLFVEKAVDVLGLYHDPSERAVVKPERWTGSSEGCGVLTSDGDEDAQGAGLSTGPRAQSGFLPIQDKH
ncbi:hypothetical protein AB0B45_30500 [Nonomuraea sp. NPDC049152]|uniref:hypothetical protein n=1 Tax=Nonomuraea sp. NPDC049152 TaxID=3154350 RepID=UPI0033D09507